MRHLQYVLIVVACVGMSLGVVFAQDDALKGGTVRGLITDLTLAQNPIEDVEVKIVAEDSDKAWTTKTDADGEYKQAGLPAGRYLISISKEGYDERVGKPVTVVEGGDHFVPLKIAQQGNIQPFFEVQQKRKHIAIKQEIKPRVESLLQGIAESVSKRYDLDPAAVDTLRLSILESVEIALMQDGNIHVFAKAVEDGSIGLLKILLSRLDCKVSFAKHLGEAQLQDYLAFTEAREVRDRQAVVHWITAVLDMELSLRSDQRDKVVQSLLDATENELFPSAMNALWFSPQQAAQLAHHRLEVALEGVLSEAQSKVWQGLVNANTNVDVFIIAPEIDIKKVIEVERIDKGEIADPNKKRTFIRREPLKPIQIEKEAKIIINEVMLDPPGKLPPWIEINADTAKSPEQMMEIAEAKLAAHTELLGPLDERAARRLALVTKGVAQEYIEARDRDREAMGELRRDGGSKTDITSHPLYQQAIKDVLSEEAFALYSEYQAEREALRQQALRGMVVAGMDMELLLDETQRERLETAASQLIPGPLKEGNSSTLIFFQLFPQTVDFEILTPWQRTEFERVFGPIAIAWRR